MNLKGKQTKRGFTLIELLAVIVILAIIALIAMPQILGVIEKSRKGAAESGAYGFIEAIEYNNVFAQTEQAGYTEITGENIDATTVNVKMKGKKPSSGTVTVSTNGKVTSANLCVEGYTVVYNGREVTSTTKGCSSSTPSTVTPESATTPEPAPTVVSGPTKVAAQAGETHKGIVYMDPTNTSATCNQENSVSTLGTKTGCMKFYIYDDDGDTYKMILDHNTTATVAWNSNGRNNRSMVEVATALSADTTGWVGSPRLITADEVAHIVGADRNDTIKWSSSKGYGTDDIETKSSWINLDGGRNSDPTVYASGSNGWQKQYANSSTPSNYAWLFDYTNGCESYGCSEEDSSNNGYWTSSPFSVDSYDAWYVYRGGNLYFGFVGNGLNYGVRPVISVSKSQIAS